MTHYIKMVALVGVSAFAVSFVGMDAYAQSDRGQGIQQRQTDRTRADFPDQVRDRDRRDTADQIRDRDREVTPDRDRDRDRGDDPDRDRLRDRDRVDIPEQDRDRDRLYYGTKDRINQHDRDRDGKVNRVEFDGWHNGNYDRMDTNGNGLTLQEYHALRFGPGPYGSSNEQRQFKMQEQANLRKTERFRLMDKDANGIVTRNEYRQFGEYNFLEADTNDDGKLTFKELNRYNRGM